MSDETSNEQLQRLAEEYRTKLPLEDQRIQNLLQVLVDYSGALEAMLDEIRHEPETPRDIAYASAIAFSMASVARVARQVLIQAAESSR